MISFTLVSSRRCAILQTTILFFIVAILLKLLPQVLKKSKSMYWFKTNQMVVNASTFQLILFGLSSNENIVLEVGECSIDVANGVTLLGVTIEQLILN